MSECGDLKFDQMEFDTTLAEEYFKNKNKVFTCLDDQGPIKDTNTSDFVLDQCGNRVHYCNEGCETFNYDVIESNTSLADSLWQLGMKVKENAELFCQLEYAVRNHPIDDVKNDLQLLINQCLNISSFMDKYDIRTNNCKGNTQRVNMSGAPLYYLSRAVSTPWVRRNVTIMVPPQAAAVCTLFTELCAQVGICWIALHLSVPEDLKPDDETPVEGCIGVVSETADLDSAVHAFVFSTTLYPWKLNMLLIQESVYDEFQKALQWKCNVNVSNEKPLEPHLKQLSADAQVGNGKIFLIDYVGVGSIQSKLHPVLVSAYRTNKELIKIMSKYEEPFVSLWCSDSSHANEIAVSISSPVVWINSYAVFNGSQVSSAVPIYKQRIRDIDELDKTFKEIETTWLKLNVEKRREVTLEVLKKYIAINDDENAIKLQTILRTRRQGFIEVNKNDMWIGIEDPVGIVYLIDENTEFLLDVIASVVYGNRVVISNIDLRHSLLLEVLKKAGLPILGLVFSSLDKNLYRIYKTRAIYSNFGTIFAN